MAKSDTDAHDFLPLNPLEFRILLALGGGCLHGYAIVKNVEARSTGSEKIFPANLYRRIRNMLASGLLAETTPPEDAVPSDDRRRKFFTLTPLGIDVAQAETGRLEQLLGEAHEGELALGSPRGSNR